MSGSEITHAFVNPTSDSADANKTQPSHWNAPHKSKEPIEFVIDGGGSALTAGMKGYLEIPFAWTDILSGRLLADQSGSVIVDIFKCTYSAFDPPTHPASGDKITASAPLTISSAKKSEDTTLTGWTKTGSAGDILGFNVNGTPSGITRVTVSLVFQT